MSPDKKETALATGKTTAKFEYKWVILITCFMMVFICLGFCSSTKSLYLGAITKALKIPRSLFSINDSFRFITSAVVNLFFGPLVYRYGIRRMTAFGFIALIASTLVYAFAQNIFVFYVGGVLLGLGLTFTTTTMASSVIRRWFKKDLGKYNGIVFAANGVGGAVATQILSPIINNGAFGYRFSYIVVAILLLVIGTAVVLLLRERPKAQPISVPPAAVTKKARGSTWVGIEYTAVVKKPYFYFCLLVVFLTGFCLQGIGSIYKTHMSDIGLDEDFVALIVSISSLLLTVAKILVGAIYDRFGLRKVMFICQGSTVTAFIALALLTPTLTGKALAIAFIILFPLALPLETLVVPLVANDLFGNANYDKILGILIALKYTGYALGSPFVNLFYDVINSYKPALFILSGVMLAAGIIMQCVINKAYKEKRAIVAAQTVAK